MKTWCRTKPRINKLFTFMAFLCHEIRNPLFAITSTASFLDDTEMTEEQEIGAGSIFDSALLMLRIVNDVLDLSIIGEGKMELEERDFDLHQLLENLVFMDLSMPVMDGYEATEEIQQHEQEANSNSSNSNSSNSNSNNEVPVHIPSIALTANALTKERDHALESGAHEFHTKPILRNDLHSICARYLETSASSTAAASIASCNSTSLGNMRVESVL
mmetsp:Transcript_18552/g.26197  ORF Transcript_18552/g.26197 Transcript_18552/m.26197 type:complete len:217 (+) Transcript_18552:367-1017(+)